MNVLLTTDDGHILRVWTGITGLTKATPQNMLIPRIVGTVDITEENDTSSRLDSAVHHTQHKSSDKHIYVPVVYTRLTHPMFATVSTFS